MFTTSFRMTNLDEVGSDIKTLTISHTLHQGVRFQFGETRKVFDYDFFVRQLAELEYTLIEQEPYSFSIETGKWKLQGFKLTNTLRLTLTYKGEDELEYWHVLVPLSDWMGVMKVVSVLE